MKLQSKTVLVSSVGLSLTTIAVAAVAQSASDIPVTQTLVLVLIGAGMLAAVAHRLKSM